MMRRPPATSGSPPGKVMFIAYRNHVLRLGGCESSGSRRPSRGGGYCSPSLLRKASLMAFAARS